MPSGEFYVEVDASVINGGIAPMAMVSGNPEPVDGQSYVVVWIRWKYDSETGDGGYTGTGWYFNDSNNGLQSFGTEDAFKQWLVDNTPTNLDTQLSSWNPTEKASFLNNHLTELDAAGCVYFTAQSAQ